MHVQFVNWFVTGRVNSQLLYSMCDVSKAVRTYSERYGGVPVGKGLVATR